MNSVVYITSAGILWGIIAIFISLLKDLGFNSLQCVAIRVFFSALFLVIYLSIFDRSKLKIEFKDIIYFLGTGIFSIIFFNYCYLLYNLSFCGCFRSCGYCYFYDFDFKYFRNNKKVFLFYLLSYSLD